jgi:hypothetical protein
MFVVPFLGDVDVTIHISISVSIDGKHGGVCRFSPVVRNNGTITAGSIAADRIPHHGFLHVCVRARVCSHDETSIYEMSTDEQMM